MKKFIRTIFVLVLALVSTALFACETNEEPVFSAEDAIKVLLVEQETYVSGDFDVPGKLHYKGTDYELAWASDNACLTVSPQVNANGNYTIVATRPEEGKQTATLTASLTVGETSATKSFSFNLYPIDVYEISDAYEFKYANKAIKESITLDTEFTYEGKTVQIKWTVDDASKNVLSIENNQVVFEEPTEEIPVKVWAEFEYNNEKALRPFNMTLIPATVGPSIVTEIADGDTFKFGFYQAEDGKYLYFAGEMNGYYGATTEDGAASTAVTVNVVEGGYQLSFINKEGNKQYITLVASGKYTNFKLVDEVPSTVWTWNDEYSTFVMDVVNTDQPEKSGLYFLGTYGSNKTFGASAISYITSDTNYIAHLYQLPYGPLANPVAGQPYKLGFYQAEEGKDLYLTGEMNGYYGATTDDVNAAVDVTAEVVEGGYHLTFMKDGSKKYITLVASGKYTNFKLVDEAPTTVWTWNAEYHTYVMDVVNTDQPAKSGLYFLGTYGSNKTFGASAISYASNPTNYIAHMYAPGASLPTEDNGDNGDNGDTGERAELTTEFTTTSYAELAALVPNASDLTSDKYYAIGYVKEISNEKYGNMVIEDAEGNTLNIYGSYSFDGKLRFDALPYEVAVNDVIVLYGVMNNYNGTVQMKNGSIVQLGTVVFTEDDAHKAAVTQNELSVVASATENFVLPLVGTTYNTVTISWASDNAAVAVNGANVTVTRPASGSENASAKLTATITSGTTTVTKVFTVDVPAVPAGGQTLATFTFGDDATTTTHVDGSSIGTDKTYTADGYSLDIVNASKVYDGANDATGKSALKLGTGSAAGSFEFTVNADVNKVIIYVAQYKNNATTVVINGQSYTIETESNSGEYTAIEIDTTTTKTITLSVTTKRCMIDQIVFVS